MDKILYHHMNEQHGNPAGTENTLQTTYLGHRVQP